MSSVDVIVPCYRYGRFLRVCVESVLSQSLRDVRVLIIDDASPDNTEEVATELVRADSRVAFIQHTQNQGHIKTYNEGIEWASADYLLVLSADDYLLPNALCRAATLLQAHPEVGFVFGRAIEWHHDYDSARPEQIPDPIDLESRIMRGLEFVELSGADNIVPTPTAVVRTQLQKRLGGYRPELPHSADMEMWLRFAAHSSVGMLNQHQAVYRHHDQNMSIAYKKDGWLPDLQQRKAALECFFPTGSEILPGAHRLYRHLMRALACRAIGFASEAFNNGEQQICAALLEFAVGVCPDFKGSWPLTKLRLKRWVGPSAWAILQPSVTRLRRLASDR